MNKPKVYLAGGFQSKWQYQVISYFQYKFEFYNPLEHKLESPKEYTAWDLHHLKHAEIVFAYMENSNPSGYGLALEIGFAKALNKTIILIDERSQTDISFNKYFSIVRECSSVIFNSLNEGISFLERFSREK